MELFSQGKTKNEVAAIIGLSWAQANTIKQKMGVKGNETATAGNGDGAPVIVSVGGPAVPANVTPQQKEEAFNMFRAGKTKGDVCRALKLSISQVKNLKQTFNAKHQTKPWESPEDWLQSQDYILSDDKVKEKAGDAPVWLLIQALHRGGRLLNGILPFCGDSEQMVTATMTREQWFEQVSKLVMEKGTLRDAIEKKWGAIVKCVTTDTGTKEKLVPTPYGAYLLHQLDMRYVPSESSFYRYFPEGNGHEKEGTWEYVTVTEVERDIMEWVVKKEIERASLEQKQISQALYYMRPLGIFTQHNFSTNPLHVKNGMLFFEEEELAPPNPAYFSRSKLPVLFDAKAGETPKRFLQFLDEASLLPEDKDLLQLWCGFVLLGDNSVHKIMMFNGDAGSGKSTLIELLERMLGHESIATLNIERLDDRFELGSFFERRLLVAKDVGADALNSQAAHMLKALSGDSLIKAEIKHQNRRVSLKGPFNITITSNTDLFIKLHGDADAWHRRLVIIKFRKKKGLVPENKLADKMFETEGSAILNWMIKGAIRARAILDEKDKFPKSAEQIKRVNELLRLSDSVKAFVSEELQSDAKGSITTADLYDAYENYCARNRVLPTPKGAFEREIVMRIQEKWGGEKGMIKDPETDAPCRGYRGVSFTTKTPPTEPTSEDVPS
jgi:P4 family phage/plasmid primase-like protien